MVTLDAQPYSSTAFNSLPSLQHADAGFKKHNTAAIISHVLADIFIKHNVVNLLGVQLLHRHFSLDNDERLVDVGGASVPWSSVGSEALDSRILPVSWAFECDTYHPYEFKFIPPGQELPDTVIHEPFFAEFNETLKAHDLQSVLGLRSLKGGHGQTPEMEITNGRSNITFAYDPDTAAGEPDHGNAIEASWAFGGSGMSTVATFCVSYCSSRSDYGAHTKFHQNIQTTSS